MIRITDLEKIYRTEEVETVALNKMNLEVNENEFVAIMENVGVDIEYDSIINEEKQKVYEFLLDNPHVFNDLNRAKVRIEIR